MMRPSNALAAPGGHLVIYSGVLKKAGSVDEVTGVLAHEMAHIEMNHPMKSVMRNLGFSPDTANDVWRYRRAQ